MNSQPGMNLIVILKVSVTEQQSLEREEGEVDGSKKSDVVGQSLSCFPSKSQHVFPFNRDQGRSLTQPRMCYCNYAE